MDRQPVTNERFAGFVAATGYRTTAEIPPDPANYPGAIPELLVPGSLLFVQPESPVDLRDNTNWWQYVQGVNWKHPQGPGTTLDGLAQHPVVHVTFDDAIAFATWEQKALPTEAEWEFAARGGLDDAPFAWGQELLKDNRHMANTWQGEFPWQQLALDGFERTSPVGTFPPNGYGLDDMIGNTWEWTTDWYVERHAGDVAKACCVPRNPRGPKLEESYDPALPAIRIPRKVLKGGSHLCAPNYCRRYRPAARYPQPVDTSTSHIGFRCIVREATAPAATTE
jgi:formylglycine-generating enzyme required for sulfatase activity